MRIVTLVFFVLLLARPAFAQLSLDIPPDWQRQDHNGQQIFLAPGRNEGFSINPANELAGLGAAGAILQNVLGQYRQQFHDLQVKSACSISPTMALAIIQRTGPTGVLGERLMVGSGEGKANIMVLWAPVEMFEAEDMKLTGGKPSCSGGGAGPAAPAPPASEGGELFH